MLVESNILAKHVSAVDFDGCADGIGIYREDSEFLLSDEDFPSAGHWEVPLELCRWAQDAEAVATLDQPCIGLPVLPAEDGLGAFVGLAVVGKRGQETLLLFQKSLDLVCYVVPVSHLVLCCLRVTGSWRNPKRPRTA